MEIKPQEKDGKNQVVLETPTPEHEMTPKEETLEPTEANPVTQEATDPLEVLKEAGITKYSTKEEAVEGLKNLNAMVGDQTVAQQRKIAEALSKQTGYSLEEIISVFDSGGTIEPAKAEQPVPQEKDTDALAALHGVRQMKVENLVKEIPEAKLVEAQILERVKATGEDPKVVWLTDFSPLVEAGRELGGKRLKKTIEGQPMKAASTAGGTQTTPDFSKMTSEEMEKVLPTIES